MILSTKTGIAGSLFKADPKPIIKSPIQSWVIDPLFFHAGLRIILPKIESTRLNEFKNLSCFLLSINLGIEYIASIS